MTRRIARLVALCGLVTLIASLSAMAARAANPTGSASSAFAATKHIERNNLIPDQLLTDGTDDVVDSRNVTVNVSTTAQLRNRQQIQVTWSGARPTSGLVVDPTTAQAAQQEYPVVVMMCRGVDDNNAPANQQVTPQTCWTQTPAERFAYSADGSSYPVYRMDRYATQEDRALTVNQPNPMPAGSNCAAVTAAHWVPFVAADGTVYPGGNLGCAGMAPEAANAANSLQPGSTTYGQTAADGTGLVNYVVQTDESNASLGCSDTVQCTLEVIPIEGISCDAAGVAQGNDLGMAPVDRPDATTEPGVESACTKTGAFQPGAFNTGGAIPDLAVTGQYWWSASNWQNRIAVPLTFAPSANVCSVVNNGSTAYMYGSELLLQATQQWAPKFCLNPKSYAIRHVQTAEMQAKLLLRNGSIPSAIQALPPDTPFRSPVVQAPIAITGFAVVFKVDDANGNAVANLRLNARLLAKLLTESYISCFANCLKFDASDAVSTGWAALANNPVDITRDPEFQALNPGIPQTIYNLEAAATMSITSADSDVITALTSYINADSEARAWLNGAPDPWGMVINPAYKGITLPVSTWPLLDTHLRDVSNSSNLCLSNSPVPWLPLVASPVLNPANIALNMQFDISNSQVNCAGNGTATQHLTAVGRELPRTRFLLGVVALADAARYELPVAQLQTHVDSSAPAKFTDATGRTFVGATTAGLKAAAKLMTPDDKIGSWVMPYASMLTSTAGETAYPGTLLISLDVPTKGLAKSDSADLASFLRYVAGPGQVPGLASGTLAAGYLPITSANGLSKMHAYTLAAAAAVTAAAGDVPHPSGKIDPVTVRHATGHSSNTPASAGSVPSTVDTSAVGSSTPSSSAPRTTNSAPAAPSSSVPTTPPTAPVALTTSPKSGAGGLVLPVVAIAGAIALLVGGWVGRVGRR
jgi:hypothetical protein